MTRKEEEEEERKVVLYYFEESSVFFVLTKRLIGLSAFCVSTSDRSFIGEYVLSRLGKRIYKLYLIESLLKILPVRPHLTKISKYEEETAHVLEVTYSGFLTIYSIGIFLRIPSFQLYIQKILTSRY